MTACLASLSVLARKAPTADLRSALMLFEEELCARRLFARNDTRPHRAALFDMAGQAIATARRHLDEASRGEGGYVHVRFDDSEREVPDSSPSSSPRLPAALKGGQHAPVVAP